MNSQGDYIYVFLDEGGNFDFSSTGTRYLTLTAVVCSRPFHWYYKLTSAKYDLIEKAREEEYFHASEDQQATRDRFFLELATELENISIHSIVIEKRKAHPSVQPLEKFYPKMLGWLVKFIVRGIENQVARSQPEIIILTDKIPVSKKRKALEKTVKQTLSREVRSRLPYKILHHDSKSSMGLQVADYCNWAVYRKWSNDDFRSYNLIKGAVKSEFDVFQSGKNFYY